MTLFDKKKVLCPGVVLKRRIFNSGEFRVSWPLISARVKKINGSLSIHAFESKHSVTILQLRFNWQSP